RRRRAESPSGSAPCAHARSRPAPAPAKPSPPLPDELRRAYAHVTSVVATPRRLIDQTDGIRRIETLVPSATDAASHSALEVPSATASGPAIAVPSGVSTKEPRASYELTRDCACSGTSCCRIVTQSVRCTAIARPPANAAAETSHVGAPAASDAGWSAYSIGQATAAAPFATRIVAHAPAPPRSCFATAGPSTFQNMKKTLPTPNSTTEAHSQVRETNSRQPSRSSRKNREPARAA